MLKFFKQCKMRRYLNMSEWFKPSLEWRPTCNIRVCVAQLPELQKHTCFEIKNVNQNIQLYIYLKNIPDDIYYIQLGVIELLN